MVSFINCCMLSICLVLLGISILVSLLISDYICTIVVYMYKHGWHSDPLSLASAFDSAKDWQLAGIITAAWCIALFIVVCIGYAMCVTLEVCTSKVLRCLCPCTARTDYPMYHHTEMEQF